jgi:hypothetical protein
VPRQEPTPKIGPFAIDLHASIPRFPSDNQQLADSRGLLLQELPGRGFGLHAGAHGLRPEVESVTFGLGGDLTVRAAHQDRTADLGRSYGARRHRALFTHSPRSSPSTSATATGGAI